MASSQAVFQDDARLDHDVSPRKMAVRCAGGIHTQLAVAANEENGSEEDGEEDDDVGGDHIG